MRIILHIDFNSYFASVEQQANPHLRGKPVGVTGGDRMKRTVVGAASIEAKKFGVKTGMQLWEAKKLCPNIILVPGDSDKYLETTKRFLNILKDFSLNLEVFSIDECFLELSFSVIPADAGIQLKKSRYELDPRLRGDDLVKIAQDIKSRIRSEIGEWIKCSIGISYNKLMAKLAGSLQKRDGLVVIPDQKTAIKVLDKVELDKICGIGGRIKLRLNNMGIFNFTQLRKAPLEALLASFKSYGQILYNMARGLDESLIVPFYEKEEVKSVGHRHTIDYDTNDPQEIKQILLKLTELVARRLRSKKLVGRTIHCWYRNALTVIPANAGIQLNTSGSELDPRLRGDDEVRFTGSGMQMTITPTNNGLEIFHAAWKIFTTLWTGDKIRMIGTSISNLKPQNPQNLSLLEDFVTAEKIIQTMDKINDKFGEFTLQRGILLGSTKMSRKPNPFLADRRFKL